VEPKKIRHWSGVVLCLRWWAAYWWPDGVSLPRVTDVTPEPSVREGRKSCPAGPRTAVREVFQQTGLCSPEAIAFAVKRDLPSGFAWDRQPGSFVTPLMAAIPARWALLQFGPTAQPPNVVIPTRS
jgi:hypothetical protein